MEILTSFVSLLSGLAIFMVGIHQMSSGLEKISSGRMQRGMSKVSNNRFVSFGFGTFITSVMQSSTLVTVMTISFLNANILTLYQGIAIVLGANVGTTLTGVISSFATFDYAIFLSLFTMVGVIIEMVSKKPGTKRIGQIFIGFGLIFIGLNFASGAFKTEAMRTYIANIFEVVNFPLLLIILSILLTAIVNSSTLIVGLSILLVSSGTIPLEYALFIVLGAEVGTTVTGLLASMGGNANAKRLALIQMIFNLLGCIIFSAIVWIFTEPIINILENVNLGFQVAAFQVFFNLSTALIAIVFIKQLEKLSYVLIKKDKDSQSTTMSLKYVTETLLKTPSFALTALDKEVRRMFELVKENIAYSFESIEKVQPIHIEKVKENEDVIDFLNGAIALYLVKLSSQRLAYQDELVIGKIYHVINDLERIADHANNFVSIVEEMALENMIFSSAAKDEIRQMTDQITLMFDLAVNIYEKNQIKKLNELSMLEYIIDKNRADFERNHVTRLRTGECLLEHSKYFFDFTSQLERIGDHLINIGYSTVNVVGDVKETKVKST